MTISVCMGIYNGARYIEAQLLSILEQTRRPEEVILCDDGSTDGTVDIVRRFLKEHELEQEWKLYENDKNMGYPGNFYHAMDLCTGEIVFLADQDDIWDIHKLERMEGFLEENPEQKAVCCKFGLVDGEGKDIHTLMAPAKSRGTGAIRQVGIEDVFYKCEWPGMVLAYRRRWYSRRKGERNMEGIRIPHDLLICVWAAEDNGFAQMDEQLAWHRRHDSNTGGEEHRLGRLLSRERKLEEIKEYNRILEELRMEEVMQTDRGRRALTEKQRIMEERYCALETLNAGEVIRSVWRNRKHIRLATAVCDIVIALKGRGKEK